MGRDTQFEAQVGLFALISLAFGAGTGAVGVHSLDLSWANGRDKAKGNSVVQVLAKQTSFGFSGILSLTIY